MTKTWLVTGGAGFIGANFVLKTREKNLARVVNLDKLTYAGNPESLASLASDPNYIFAKGDICDPGFVAKLLAKYQPSAVIHFAAESHVDRSIDKPESFVQTNVLGTFHLLQEAKNYWLKLEATEKNAFRFLHVSTDEVFGSLNETDDAFDETTGYAPNSPYSASKAGSDHLVRSYFHTFHFPTITTNCSNNYGPFQFPEKLIPLCMIKALKNEALPVYGDGKNIRDWLFVEDHVSGIHAALQKGRPGETYCIGGNSEKRNIEVVEAICEILDELKPKANRKSYKEQITFVKDRPGHDRRYAINAEKIKDELGWTPSASFKTGLTKTITWYLENQVWWERIFSGAYRGERLGNG